MSRLNVANFRHPSGTVDNISLNSTGLVQIGDSSSGNGNPQLRLHRGSGSDYLDVNCSGGSTTLNQVGGGNIYIAMGGTEKIRFQAAGGISFNGDTASTNAFDDYEEGTFTPTLVWSGGSTSVTYNHQKGGYVKMGNVVHFYGYLALSNFSGASGNAKLSNFPFAAKNLTTYYHAPAIGWYTNLGGVTAYGLGLDIAPNSTSHTILRGTGTSITGLNPADVNSNFALEWGFTVHVN